MPEKIIVVDDSPVVRNIHTFMIESAGYKVVTASNGYEASEILLQDDDFSLIVTDINMPKMDGYTLIREIRKIDQYKDTPIIIISTESEAKDKQKGFNAGANIYIVKPVDQKELIMNINMLLGKKK